MTRGTDDALPNVEIALGLGLNGMVPNNYSSIFSHEATE
jgi:hypothetical protein